MQYLYNEHEDYEAVFIYPDGWLDVVRILIIKLLCRGFDWTWGHKRLRPSNFTIERKLRKTEYPSLCSGG